MLESEIIQLLEQCRTGETKQQAPAIQRLIHLKAEIAVPVMLDLLKSPDEGIRCSAAGYLGNLGTREVDLVGSALINLLADPEEIVRSEAVDSLGMLGYRPARKLVESLLLNDPDAIVRASSAEALGNIGDSEAIESLKLSMQDHEEIVRAYSAIALGLIGTSELLPDLQSYIESESSLQVEAELLAAKYRLDESENIYQILQLLQNADENLATIILNILTDLISCKTLAKKITHEIDKFCLVLNTITQKFSILSPQAQDLMIKLKKLES